MIDHVSLGTTRYAAAVNFYQHALAPLGVALQRDTGREAAFGSAQTWSFYLYPIAAGEAVTAPGMHLALGAATRAQVTAVHAAALAAGAADLFTPRTRPEISERYFGAMFTDLDGHRIEVKTDGD